MSEVLRRRVPPRCRPDYEHACICCPVLQVDPRQRPRLIEIIQNLRERMPVFTDDALRSGRDREGPDNRP